jgi:hypothetical protein
MPRDIQEDARGNIGTGNIHLDRKAHVQNSNDDISDLDLEDNRQEGFVEGTKQFIQKSRKEWKAFNRQKQSNLLSGTKLGKVTKPLTKKQKSFLQTISNDNISEHLKNRK